MRYCLAMSTDPKPGEVLTRERCYIAELLNDAATPEVSVARCRVPPGVCTELHSLNVLETYVIESGHGMLRLGEEPGRTVGPGDRVRIPPGTPQQVTALGDVDLVFLCVCLPRFTPGAYTPLE